MKENERCANVVPCPYCTRDFHVCDVFPPPTEEEGIGGEQTVRCNGCYKPFTLHEELVVTYRTERHADKGDYQN